jgi:hypothetical protein
MCYYRHYHCRSGNDEANASSVANQLCHNWIFSREVGIRVHHRLTTAYFYLPSHRIISSFSFGHNLNIGSGLCATRSQRKRLYVRQSCLLVLERSSGRVFTECEEKRCMCWLESS